MSKPKSIGMMIAILVVGNLGAAYILYKVFIDKPGFFINFPNKLKVREFLLDHLLLNVSTKADTLRFMRDYVSKGEACFIDPDQNRMVCYVRSQSPRWDGTWMYKIEFNFDGLKLIQLEIDRFWNGNKSAMILGR